MNNQSHPLLHPVSQRRPYRGHWCCRPGAPSLTPKVWSVAVCITVTVTATTVTVTVTEYLFLTATTSVVASLRNVRGHMRSDFRQYYWVWTQSNLVRTVVLFETCTVGPRQWGRQSVAGHHGSPCDTSNTPRIERIERILRLPSARAPDYGKIKNPNAA